MSAESTPDGTKVVRKGSRVRAALVALVLITLFAAPPVRTHAKASGLVLETLPLSVKPLSFLTPEPTKTTVRLGDTVADVYRPRGFSRAPSVVAIHGAAPKGKDDARLQEFARALASTGRRVVVPDLGLRKERLDVADLQRIRDAVTFAGDQGPAGVIGFSYGGGMALVAIADDAELRRKVPFVATVGAYFDLVHVVQGVTTATVPYRGRNVRWNTVPEARDLLAEQLSFFVGGKQGEHLGSAWDGKDPSTLDAEMQSLYRLIDNRDPELFPELFRGIPPRVRAVLTSISPSHHLDEIDFPVYALHSTDDPAAPPSESALLVTSTEEEGSKLFIVDILRHVDPLEFALENIDDIARLVRFSGLALAAQEGWPRP